MSARCILFLLLLPIAAVAFGDPPSSGEAAEDGVSYFRQVRPILQANCQGCHQPAKAEGRFAMTAFDSLLAGGESRLPAIVPGAPDESYLIDLITPLGDAALMPPDKPPLPDDQIALIRRWIEQGAEDDTPANAQQRYDMDHPPVYTAPPAITSLDYSPDGTQLAVAGFHEVLLLKPDGSQTLARLVGLSQRIESVRFSPDGALLAVTGGVPGRMGELQVWQVDEQRLVLSLPVTYDTVYGGSWSPDGRLVAFGGADNLVRAVEVSTGEQVVSMAAHDDWVRGTVFSGDGRSIFSASRDMTVKMTDVATQRFVGNATTHTPGVLRGGQQAIQRHPSRDELLVGGADGTAKLFKMDVQAAPAGGGNPNQIREYPALEGRVFDVRFSPDGSQAFAASSLDGRGQVACYETDSGQRTWQLDVDGGLYAVACSPHGQTLAVAGADGRIRLIDAATGEVDRVVQPFPLEAAESAALASGTGAEESEQPSTDGIPDFVRDVNPVLTRLGCNNGMCHGSAEGQNGFQLSLRGYDALFDVRALTDDLAARRVNVSSPDDSLMLLKTTAAVPHRGGQLLEVGDAYYEILRGWIAGGAQLDLTTPRVAQLEVLPDNPVLQMPGEAQQMQVIATYADGATRDVTREAFIESGDPEVVEADRNGMMTAIRRGEAAVLVRYDGAYAATTMTVMGDRSGFTWQTPETRGRIDELVAEKWQRMKIEPAPLCDDTEFIRRVWLDLTGLPPTADHVRDFLADPRDSRIKRDELVDQLIGSDDFIEYWTNKWADLLQVNRKFLAAEGAAAFRHWIRDRVARNVPYDQFVRELLTASGSNRENPAASYYKILRTPQEIMENSTHLFLGVRFNCNKCHDHPFERWTQDQYYQTAAYFAELELTPDPASGERTIGGTAVQQARPLYEIVADKPSGDLRHERTGELVAPQLPFDAQYTAPPDATRRDEFAAWITSPDNPYFARSYVNRLWGYLLGVGLMEPLDDLRAGNPPTNPELLDYLTEQFIDSGFDMRHVVRLITQSRTYQLSVQTHPWNADDKINYSRALPRRLPAEVLYDAVCRVTGSLSRFPGVPPGTRAAALPDAGVELPDGFLASLGRPVRESACECERSGELHLGAVMALISGPSIDNAISDPNSDLAKLAASDIETERLVDEIFLRVLNRPAMDQEIEAARGLLQSLPEEHEQLVQQLQEGERALAPEIEQAQRQRDAAIAEAQSELEAYQQQIAPREAELDRQQQQQIADAEAALAEYTAGLPQRQQQWEQQVQQPAQWTLLDPIELAASNNAQLEKQDDSSVFASGPNGKGHYTFTARTDVAGITGIRLEVLTDERLPNNGPGRAQNGNFVLSELGVQWAAETQPDDQMTVALENAQADFSQQNYPVASAIDGRIEPANNGWATSPRTGENRTAVFQTTRDVGQEPGLLTLTLHQEYQDGQHAIGRFRVAVTTAPRPIGLEALPENITKILAIAVDQRSDQQQAELLAFYRDQDTELKRREQALAEARTPRPVDPNLQRLRDRLATASQPLRIDPELARLRHDAALSSRQLQNVRLTLAQDLAWALINTPAFLFNR